MCFLKNGMKFFLLCVAALGLTGCLDEVKSNATHSTLNPNGIESNVRPISVVLDSKGWSDITKINAKLGERIVLPMPERTGYSFIGWRLEGQWFRDFYDVSKPVTLVADWESTAIKVKLSGMADNRTEIINAKLGTEIELVKPIRKGYEFVGWSDGVHVFHNKYIVSGFVTLYAKWKIRRYTLQFNDPYNEPIEQLISDFKSFIDLPLPTRTGYNFIGWRDVKSKKIVSNNYVVLDNAKFNAQWEKKITKYRLTFNTRGGEPISEWTLVKGSSITLPKAKRPGYKFLGWTNDIGVLLNNNLTINDNVIVTAKWSEIKVKIIVNKYDSKGMMTIKTYFAKPGDKIKLPEVRATVITTSAAKKAISYFFTVADGVEYIDNLQREYSSSSSIKLKSNIRDSKVITIDQKWEKIDLKKWMKSIDDNTLISNINIPGTHDSAALYDMTIPIVGAIGGTARTQSLSIKEQLEQGVRFFDFRFKQYNATFQLYHGIVSQRTNFDPIMDVITSFLKSNPSEFLIISIKKEQPAKEPWGSFESTLLNTYINRYSVNWYTKPDIPTIGQVRGSIYLINRNDDVSFGLPAYRGWGNNTESKGVANNKMYVQDQYELSSACDKKKSIDRGFSEASNLEGSAIIALNFTSGIVKNFVGIPNINKVVDCVNPYLKDNIFSDKDKGAETFIKYGIVATDYMDGLLSAKIIGSNWIKECEVRQAN